MRRHLGLDFETERPIGAPSLGSCAPDVIVHEGASATEGSLQGVEIAADRHLGVDYYSIFYHAERYTLRVHTLCDFMISRDGSTVECRPVAGTDPDVVSVLLSGTVTAFLWMLRGRAVLHGSAVLQGSTAVALLGQSGSGKSTVAALCCAAGAKVLSDDLVVLETSRDAVWCLGGATELRLRPGMRSVTNLWPVKPAERETGDGRTAISAPSTNDPADGRLRLGVAALLCPSPEAAEVRLNRLHGTDAVFALMAQSRVTGLCDIGFNADLLAATAAVARHVAVVAIEVPWRPPFSLDLAGQLLDTLGGVTTAGAGR